MLLVVLQEFGLTIDSAPVIVELADLFFVNIVVMVGLLDVVANFLLDDLAAPVVEHPFLGDAVQALVVFVGLLFLRDGVPSLILAHVILEIVLSVDFAIGSHFGGAHVSLAHEGSLPIVLVHILMD